MKEIAVNLLAQAAQSLQQQGLLEDFSTDQVNVERTRGASHGDFASNLAMKLAKQARCNPRELAQKLVDLIPVDGQLEKIEIAGPGFINFYFAQAAYLDLIDVIRKAKGNYGHSNVDREKPLWWNLFLQTPQALCTLATDAVPLMVMRLPGYCLRQGTPRIVNTILTMPVGRWIFWL